MIHNILLADWFITTIDAGTRPITVAVNPAINKVYVVNRLDQNVTVIYRDDNSIPYLMKLLSRLEYFRSFL